MADPGTIAHAIERGSAARERFELRAEKEQWRKVAERESKWRSAERKTYRTGRKWALLIGFMIGLLFAFGCAWLSGLMLVAR